MLLRITLSEIMDRWLFEAITIPELPGTMPELISRSWTQHRGLLSPAEALFVVQTECSALQERICSRG